MPLFFLISEHGQVWTTESYLIVCFLPSLGPELRVTSDRVQLRQHAQLSMYMLGSYGWLLTCIIHLLKATKQRLCLR